MSKGRRLPPLTTADVVRMLRYDGWLEVKGTTHRNFEHPTKPGKVQVSPGWVGVKPGSNPWRGLLAQTGWSKDELMRTYWASR